MEFGGPPESSRALLLVVVLELSLALPGDDSDWGRSNKAEISTVATGAGCTASVRDAEPVYREVFRAEVEIECGCERDGQ